MGARGPDLPPMDDWKGGHGRIGPPLDPPVCTGYDFHGEREARAYNVGLGAAEILGGEPPMGVRGLCPLKLKALLPSHA